MDDATRASYEQAGFGSATAFGASPAVLVVDMCQAYFSPGSALDLGQPEVIEAVQTLVAAARSVDVPVVWTRVEYEPNDAVTHDWGVWYRKVPALKSFDRGNPLGDWLPGVEPRASETVITKHHASGFAGTDLAAELRSLGVDSVLVGGVSTSGCVRATATDASAAGFIPFVIREAVGDRTPAVHEANLFDLHAKYADVISLAKAVAYLSTRGSSGQCTTVEQVSNCEQ